MSKIGQLIDEGGNFGNLNFSLSRQKAESINNILIKYINTFIFLTHPWCTITFIGFIDDFKATFSYLV